MVVCSSWYRADRAFFSVKCSLRSLTMVLYSMPMVRYLALKEESLSMKIRVPSSMWCTLNVLPKICILMKAESEDTPDCSYIVKRAASSVALKFTEQRKLVTSTLGGRPDFLGSCFVGRWILVVWLETANRRFLYADYDSGVIATLSIARVLCSQSNFLLRKTYLARGCLTTEVRQSLFLCKNQIIQAAFFLQRI